MRKRMAFAQKVFKRSDLSSALRDGHPVNHRKGCHDSSQTLYPWNVSVSVIYWFGVGSSRNYTR
jgi:hypothetical protein